MPLTQKVMEMVHDLEDDRRNMSWDNLDEVDAARRDLNLPCSLDGVDRSFGSPLE